MPRRRPDATTALATPFAQQCCLDGRWPYHNPADQLVSGARARWVSSNWANLGGPAHAPRVAANRSPGAHNTITSPTAASSSSTTPRTQPGGVTPGACDADPLAAADRGKVFKSLSGPHVQYPFFSPPKPAAASNSKVMKAPVAASTHQRAGPKAQSSNEAVTAASGKYSISICGPCRPTPVKLSYIAWQMWLRFPIAPGRWANRARPSRVHRRWKGERPSLAMPAGCPRHHRHAGAEDLTLHRDGTTSKIPTRSTGGQPDARRGRSRPSSARARAPRHHRQLPWASAEGRSSTAWWRRRLAAASPDPDPAPIDDQARAIGKTNRDPVQIRERFQARGLACAPGLGLQRTVSPHAAMGAATLRALGPGGPLLVI